MDKIKEEHKASFDENDIRDFIDAFIKEMKEGHESEAGFTVSQPTIIPVIMLTIKLKGIARLSFKYHDPVTIGHCIIHSFRLFQQSYCFTVW